MERDRKIMIALTTVMACLVAIVIYGWFFIELKYFPEVMESDVFLSWFGACFFSVLGVFAVYLCVGAIKTVGK